MCKEEVWTFDCFPQPLIKNTGKDHLAAQDDIAPYIAQVSKEKLCNHLSLKLFINYKHHIKKGTV